MKTQLHFWDAPVAAVAGDAGADADSTERSERDAELISVTKRLVEHAFRAAVAQRRCDTKFLHSLKKSVADGRPLTPGDREHIALIHARLCP